MQSINVIFDEKCMDKTIIYTKLPKSKKKRIVKKWNKKFFIEKMEPSKRMKLVAITMDDKLVGMCHPNLKDRLIEANQNFSGSEEAPFFIFPEE